MKSVLFSLIAVFLLVPTSSRAADATGGEAAFLFAYEPKPGHEEQFDAGYRRHLEWHRQHRDPLPWYGWYVATGERTGMFVDGSFGITFAAFDERVEPGQDAANFAETTAPHGDTAYRKILRLMPRLGTATRLEDREPSSRIEVVTYFVRPGQTAAFESGLEKLATAVGDSRAFTVYRQLSGGMQPAYLIMFPREGFGYFDENGASLDALIRTELDAEPERELLDVLSRSVRHAHSETWRYRDDLSYLPE
jgi:hypothetical protein